MTKKVISVSVALNETRDIATIKTGTRSNPIVVNCLGVDTNEQGQLIKVYVNAKLHRDGKSVIYEGWAMSGAVSTILTRV